jgi:hypothetical protein
MLEAGYFAADGVVLYEGPSLLDGNHVRLVYHIRRTHAVVHLLPYPPVQHIGDLEHLRPGLCGDCALSDACDVMSKRRSIALRTYVPPEDVPALQDLFRDALVEIWANTGAVPVHALEPLSSARETVLCLDTLRAPSDSVKTT